MNDLTLTTNSLARKPTSPELSPHLSALLDSDGSPDEAAREIGSYLALREEARAALPALRAVAEWKAGEEGVRAVIGRRFALYPQPDRSEGEWAAWWSDYADVLADVPLASLEAAMRAWVARPAAQFLPKPGELHDLAFRTVSKTLRRYQRARRALMLVDEPETPVPQIGSQEGIADPGAIHRMLAEFQAQAATRQMERASLPSIAGKPDEGGLTPQMRELMARRATQ